MKNYTGKELGQNIFAVLLGLGVGSAVGAVLIYVVGMWSLGQDDVHSFKVLFFLSLAFCIPCYLAGVVTARLSTQNYLLHALLTGLLLALVLLINNDFRFDAGEWSVWLVHYYIVFFSWLGGFVVARRKKRIAITEDKISSPVDKTMQ